MEYPLGSSFLDQLDRIVNAHLVQKGGSYDDYRSLRESRSRKERNCD